MAWLAGMKILAGLTGLWLLLAPLPPGIALNHQTKECAGFWGGDEYIINVPQEGWVAYTLGRGALIQTEIGSCTYAPSEGYGPAEHCCRQLGYKYIEDDVSKTRWSPLQWGVLAVYALRAGGVCLAIGLGVALVVGGILLLRRSRRRRREARSEGEKQPTTEDAGRE